MPKRPILRESSRSSTETIRPSRGSSSSCSSSSEASLSEAARRAGGGGVPGFFTLTPCRLLDTRTQPGGPIAAGAVREVAVSGCSVPSTATSVAINVTALGSTSSGDVAVYAVDPPTVANSIVSFGLGAVRANNAIAPISATGTLKIKPSLSSLATTHVVVDVVGYFQ